MFSAYAIFFLLLGSFPRNEGHWRKVVGFPVR